MSEDLEGGKPPLLQTKTLSATGFFKSATGLVVVTLCA